MVEAIQAAGGAGVFASARVNAVSPGATRTEGTAAMGDALDQLASLAPAGRPAGPEEISSAIVCLVSDQASFVQGVVLPVDGGRAATRDLSRLPRLTKGQRCIDNLPVAWTVARA